MNECPTCEYHKKRAQIWRDEAYRLAGHPLPRKETMIEDDDDIQDYKKPWVGLRAEEIEEIQDAVFGMKPHYVALAKAVEAKLKEKNA